MGGGGCRVCVVCCCWLGIIAGGCCCVQRSQVLTRMIRGGVPVHVDVDDDDGGACIAEKEDANRGTFTLYSK